ncbi:histidinol-phosphate aminotransferase [Deinobacterium chartae]|uniref:histidinol-phosphate transaminase n=1 Tax=Deinobacterium chartae TaxID=521158 RepID=A0A841HZC8_9DEIO|nr:histidinol-phosphate aminotransferase [Deinobacterium chartae]
MDFPPLARAPHGGGAARIDFSVNSNPFGPNPLLVEAWRSADLARYPDPTYRAARAALGALHGYDPDAVALAVGSSELMYRLALSCLNPGDRVVALGAPFGEFARACALVRADLEVRSPSDPGRMNGVRMIYLSNPHNPTGRVLTAAELEVLLELGPLVVLDEAYAEFLAEPPRLAPHPRLLRLRSPGKAHGIVGARPAYALGPAGLIARLNNLQSAWALPAPLEALLLALPRAGGFLERTLPQVRALAAELAAGLGARPTGLPFFTVRVPDAPGITARLLGRGLRVRDCGSYGHADLLRVSTRTAAENRELVAAWKELR